MSTRNGSQGQYCASLKLSGRTDANPNCSVWLQSVAYMGIVLRAIKHTFLKSILWFYRGNGGAKAFAPHRPFSIDHCHAFKALDTALPTKSSRLQIIREMFRPLGMAPWAASKNRVKHPKSKVDNTMVRSATCTCTYVYMCISYIVTSCQLFFSSPHRN